MSSDPEDERTRIREQKLAELRERHAEEGSGGSADPQDGGDDHGGYDEPVYVNGRDDLDALVDAGGVVLVDFYADWCGPCKMIEPIVERLAAETSATVAKVDVDANQRLAQQFGVRGVPTLVLYADGEQVEQTTGAPSEAQLRALIEQYT